jgi:hypothetical protein
MPRRAGNNNIVALQWSFSCNSCRRNHDFLMMSTESSMSDGILSIGLARPGGAGLAAFSGSCG